MSLLGATEHLFLGLLVFFTENFSPFEGNKLLGLNPESPGNKKWFGRGKPERGVRGVSGVERGVSLSLGIYDEGVP
jgi:hypothetical protein